MSAQPSIRIVKSIPWRGGSRLVSNRYHFTGADPLGSTNWTTLADAVVASERQQYTSDISIVEAVGYNGGSEVPVFTKSYTTAGNFPSTSIDSVPGECAALLKFNTTQRTTKNHPIYLFNYFHGIRKHTGNAGDVIDSDQRGAVVQYTGTNWVTGFSDGTATRHRCGPQGAVGSSPSVLTYFTHRDFPR